MTIDIICPLYNAEEYIEKQFKQLKLQTRYKDVINISYVITRCGDKTEQLVEKLQQENEKIKFHVIEKEVFSHSLIREKEVYASSADIIVFITQDVKVERTDWLDKLVKPIENNEVAASYSRQLCYDKKSMEYYTRQINYPSESSIKTKEMINEYGIKTFFYSDASSAINRKIFIELKGYDNKNLVTNEDMYIAYKLIMNGYKIKYCADSEVVHSHNFSLKETYMRYKTYGQFLASEPQVDVKSTKAGSGMAMFILKSALRDMNFRVIFKFMPDMVARFIGIRSGKRDKKCKEK